MREYVRGKKEQLNEKATVRFETMPGKQGQMDWGFFEDHTVYEDGKWKKLYCFLMILGYSQTRYIEFVTDMTTNTLIRCHQNAFRYFGGYPEEILYDNMKQVVIKRLLKQEDSTLNRQFEDFAGFYGYKPILCRPYRGQTKGKVESSNRFLSRLAVYEGDFRGEEGLVAAIARIEARSNTEPSASTGVPPAVLLDTWPLTVAPSVMATSALPLLVTFPVTLAFWVMVSRAPSLLSVRTTEPFSVPPVISISPLWVPPPIVVITVFSPALKVPPLMVSLP